MTNMFRDQDKFMTACEQTISGVNDEQFKMYCILITE